MNKYEKAKAIIDILNTDEMIFEILTYSDGKDVYRTEVLDIKLDNVYLPELIKIGELVNLHVSPHFYNEEFICSLL